VGEKWWWGMSGSRKRVVVGKGEVSGRMVVGKGEVLGKVYSRQ
jgi:hypothetical protein